MASFPNMLRTGLTRWGFLNKFTALAATNQGAAKINPAGRLVSSNARFGRVSNAVSSLTKEKEQYLHQEFLGDTSEKDATITKNVISKVNEQIKNKDHGRLFAIVHVAGKQYRVTQGDLILVEGHWEPGLGEEVFLEKVLLLGSKDFTLLGRPVLDNSLVKVRAQVVEKTLSHTKTHFLIKRRKQYKRINFYRIPQTLVRIQGVCLTNELNSLDESDNRWDS